MGLLQMSVKEVVARSRDRLQQHCNCGFEGEDMASRQLDQADDEEE